MASAGSLNRRPVFVATNFGTRIVVAVSVECTVGHFKNEFKNVHFSCFPELGKVEVETLKIRRKSCFYDLPELFPLKHAFEGAKGWFLRVVAQRVENPSAFKKIDKRLKRKRWKKRKRSQYFKASFFKVSKALYFLARIKKKWHAKKKFRDFEEQINGIDQEPLKSGEDKVLGLGSNLGSDMDIQAILGIEKEKECHSESNLDGDMDIQAILKTEKSKLCDDMAIQALGTEKKCHSESTSEAVSVSGIINRYFSSCDEVNSNSRLSVMGSIHQIKAKRDVNYQNIQSPLAPRTPTQVRNKIHHGPNCRSLDGKPGSGVGVRVVEASKSFGLSKNRITVAHALSKFIDGGSMVTGSENTHVRRLIFEIPDDDD